MSSKNWNLAVAISLLVGAILITAFLASLTSATGGEIAQALANLLGAALGTIGAFLVARWTMGQQGRKDELHRQSALTLILSELHPNATLCGTALLALRSYDIDNGRVPVEYFRGETVKENEIHHREGMPLSILPAELVWRLENVRFYARQLRELRDTAHKHDFLIDGSQMMFWLTLENYRTAMLAALEIVSDPTSTIYIEYLRAFRVSDFAPAPGRDYEPGRLGELESKLQAAFGLVDSADIGPTRRNSGNGG
jgi:hypothetical protein